LVRENFSRVFGYDSENIYTSPGRINLIGEHTDYNGSFVFPGTIDKGITAAIRPSHRKKVKVYAIDLDEQAEFGLNEEDKPSLGSQYF
jgi:galactokinase